MHGRIPEVDDGHHSRQERTRSENDGDDGIQPSELTSLSEHRSEPLVLPKKGRIRGLMTTPALALHTGCVVYTVRAYVDTDQIASYLNVLSNRGQRVPSTKQLAQLGPVLPVPELCNDEAARVWAEKHVTSTKLNPRGTFHRERTLWVNERALQRDSRCGAKIRRSMAVRELEQLRQWSVLWSSKTIKPFWAHGIGLGLRASRRILGGEDDDGVGVELCRGTFDTTIDARQICSLLHYEEKDGGWRIGCLFGPPQLVNASCSLCANAELGIEAREGPGPAMGVVLRTIMNADTNMSVRLEKGDELRASYAQHDPDGTPLTCGLNGCQRRCGSGPHRSGERAVLS